jgi:hypothetical protein
VQSFQIERLQHVEFEELRRTVVRGLAEIETLAAGGLQLVDLLLVLAERGGADLDPGGLLEVADGRDQRRRSTTVLASPASSAGGIAIKSGTP